MGGKSNRDSTTLRTDITYATIGGTMGGAVHFPTGLPAVDKLLENDDYIDCACQLLGTDEIRSVMGKYSSERG